MLTFAACGPRPASLSDAPASTQTRGIETSPNLSQVATKGLASPESILRLDSAMFVSNVGPDLQPKRKDGDGFISKMSLEGKVIQKQFIKGLDAPKGMAHWDSLLFVADINQVRVFHVQTGDSLRTYDFRAFETSFLNDMCRGDSGFVFVSATDINKLFRIDMNERNPEKAITEVSIPKDARVKGINGLSYDAPTGDLYMVGFGADGAADGSIAVMSLKGPARPRKFDTHQGQLDGVHMEEGQLYFTDWSRFEEGKPLWRMDLGTFKVFSIPNAPAISGPADFCYDSAAHAFWIPSMVEGNIYRVGL